MNYKDTTIRDCRRRASAVKLEDIPIGGGFDLAGVIYVRLPKLDGLCQAVRLEDGYLTALIASTNVHPVALTIEVHEHWD